MTTDQLIDELSVYAKNFSILVVEDEDELREEMCSLLHCFFREVEGCENGKKALEVYKENKFDLVITDLNMPEMNGIEFSRAVKTLNKEQIVVVLSGYINESVIDLIDIGIDTLILKPYNLDIFLQKLIKHCENIVLKKEFEKYIIDQCFAESMENEINDTKKDVKTNAFDDMVKFKSKIDNPIESKSLSFNSQDDNNEKTWKFIKDELDILNNEFMTITDAILEEGINEKYLKFLARIFNKYYQHLHLITQLTPLAKEFLELSKSIQMKSDFNKEIKKEELKILEYFYEDIMNFFYLVFVCNETQNIEYLTSSLKSTVSQIKTNLL